jgi:Holliday junction resolvase RusA-like endonuclease
MFKTDNMQELSDQFAVMIKDQDPQFVAGYAVQMAVDMLDLMPKRKQKALIKQIEAFNDRQLVTVKNCLTGKDVEIRRGDVGSCNDPSRELFHTM